MRIEILWGLYWGPSFWETTTSVHAPRSAYPRLFLNSSGLSLCRLAASRYTAEHHTT